MLIRPEQQLIRKLNQLQIFNINEFVKDQRIEYEEVETCMLCGNHVHEHIAEKDQFGIPCLTVCCSNCGLIFSKQQMTYKSTKLFYDEYYRKIYEGVTGPNLEHGFYKRLYSGWVPKVPAFIDENKFVVEIGCGGGWSLLPYLKKKIKHAGFDYDSQMIRYGQENYGLNLFLGGADEFIAACSSVDYMILSQVLEHAKDPLSFLKSIRLSFSRDGLICITVPSVDYMRYFGGNSTHFDIEMNLQNAHNFTFSEESLKELLYKAGYEPVLILGGYALARAHPRGSYNLYNKREGGHGLEVLKKIMIKTARKYMIQRLFPLYVYNNLISRSFYFANPLKTVRYLAVNRLGIGL